MSRALVTFLLLIIAFGGPLAAQQSLGTTQGTPPERIDLLAEAKSDIEGPEFEDCSAEQEAAIISGAIIVCRRRVDNSARLYDSETALSRHAAETMNKGDPKAPDVSGPGIFKGPATVGKLCIPGIAKCPPPPAYMIDFKTLPEAPAGSDADRIARGLAPRGSDGNAPAPANDPRQSELGLPDPATTAGTPPGLAESVNLSGSASGAAAP